MDCHALPHVADDGPGNMATDHWMLEAVIAEPGAAILRTYEWTEPTLSLGYFQRSAEAGPRWADTPMVRRSTGGGAIWHDRELTYAVAVPASHPLAGRSEAFYRAVHGAVATLLNEHGLDARRRGDSGARAEADRPFLCFLDRDPEDLVIGSSKVLGSAQRRRRGVLLQHGSLLLGRSGRTPELAGLDEFGRALPMRASDWAGAVRARIAGALGLSCSPREPGPAARGRIAELADRPYRDEQWLRRR